MFVVLKAYLIASTSWQLSKIKIIFIKTRNRRKLVKRNELVQDCMQYSLLIIIYLCDYINKPHLSKTGRRRRMIFPSRSAILDETLCLFYLNSSGCSNTQCQTQVIFASVSRKETRTSSCVYESFVLFRGILSLGLILVRLIFKK